MGGLDAVGAAAGDLKVVVDVAVAVVGGNLRDPLFQARAGDLGRAAAAPADKVMVVPGAAAPVQHLTPRRSGRVYFTGPD